MRTILEYVKSKKTNAVSNIDISSERNSLFTTKQLKTNSFEQIILNHFKPWIGKSVKEIIEHFIPGTHTRAKDINYVAACLIASEGKLNGRGQQHIENTDEFKKSGIRLKTISVYSNGRLKEGMSYENIDYEELYDNSDWYESTTYELFSSRFLFLVFRHPTIKSGSFHYDFGPMILERVFFWTMPQKDLDVARKYWSNIREHVLKDEIALKYFWKAGNHRLFHVRPKGNANSYKNAAINPNGGKADKTCYWFNREYVADIIAKNGNSNEETI